MDGRGWAAGVAGLIVAMTGVFALLLQYHVIGFSPAGSVSKSGSVNVSSGTEIQGGASPRVQNTGGISPAHPADTCRQGYVWREARVSDHVCVTAEVRAQTADDNRQASARRNPAGGPYGPDTCLPPYVWRGAFDGDHVCVTTETRQQTAADNAGAASRVASA